MRLLPEETLQTPEVWRNAHRLVKKKRVCECVCTRACKHLRSRMRLIRLYRWRCAFGPCRCDRRTGESGARRGAFGIGSPSLRGCTGRDRPCHGLCYGLCPHAINVFFTQRRREGAGDYGTLEIHVTAVMNCTPLPGKAV